MSDTEVLAAAILLIAPQARVNRVGAPVHLARAALHLGLPIPPDLRREALCADDTSVLPLEDAADLWLLDPAARQIVTGIGRPDPGKPSTDAERARVAGLAQCEFGAARRRQAAVDEGVPIPAPWGSIEGYLTAIVARDERGRKGGV